MSTAVIVLPIILIFAILAIALPVLLGIFVYRDAKARNMDALLWTLIAVLVPSFLGLIIYLVVRRDKIALTCPTCSADVDESYTVCPGCGQRLKAACTNCGTPLASGWKLCPHCGQEIKDVEGFASPIPKKGKSGKGLAIAIAAIILVPVLLAVLTFGMFVVIVGAESSSSDHTVEQFVDVIANDFDPTVLGVTDIELEDDDKAWLSEVKKSESGIYSRVLDTEASSGEWMDAHTEQNEGAFEYETGYILLVINSPDGRACNFLSETHCNVGDYICEDISVIFKDVDISDADQNNGVIVLKFLRMISVDSDGFAVNEKFTDDSFSLYITNNDSVELQGNNAYKISTEKDGFIPFASADNGDNSDNK